MKSDDLLYSTPGAHTNGGGILANYNFKHGFSLSVRPEYIKSSGGVITDEANLLGYGPGTGAFSFTVTPTGQRMPSSFAATSRSFIFPTSSRADFGFGIGGSAPTRHAA